MRTLLVIVVIALISLLFSVVPALSLATSLPGSDIKSPSSYNYLRSGKFGSKLYEIVVPGSTYENAPYLLDLHGPDSYSQGFDAGYLLGKEMIETYNSLMVSLLGSDWWEPAAAEAIGLFLDWQWNDYLSIQVPDEYIQELKGLSAGGFASGQKHDLGKLCSRGIVLANLPGSLENFKFILEDEKEHPYNPPSEAQTKSAMILEKIKKRWKGVTCSMFGTWGSRTLNGQLYSGRNLDWLEDTGMSVNKLVTVFHPKNAYSYATIGWAGLWGAITGISSNGLTVHEANLESNDITFRGYPWVTRLRDVMSKARDLSEAQAIWQSTNNTVGFNHGIGSASDKQFICLETMAGNTATFSANDPREQDLIVDGLQIGQARPDAVFRTNHGYDPYTIEHYMWNNTGAYADSIDRYMAFPYIFDNYAAANTLISPVEAVNITAILGHKGGDKYLCQAPYDGGSNVLSVAYDPSHLTAYTAWESGSEATWAPAGCSTYIKLDLTQWFKKL